MKIQHLFIVGLFVIFGCSKDKQNPQNQKLKLSKTLSTVPASSLSGEDLFNSLYLLDGEFVSHLPTLMPYRNQVDTLASQNSQLQIIQHDMALEIDSIINANYPTYFSNFKAALSSPNLYEVKAAVINGEKLFDSVGLLSLKYRNLFHIGNEILANHQPQIDSILDADTYTNPFLSSQNSSSSGIVSDLPPNPTFPMDETSIRLTLGGTIGTTFASTYSPLPKFNTTEQTKLALSSLVQNNIDDVEPLVCLPYAAVCVVYIAVMVHSVAVASYNIVGVANVVGAFTVIWKTAAWFGHGDRTNFPESFNDDLVLEISNAMTINP